MNLPTMHRLGRFRWEVYRAFGRYPIIVVHLPRRAACSVLLDDAKRSYRRRSAGNRHSPRRRIFWLGRIEISIGGKR